MGKQIIAGRIDLYLLIGDYSDYCNDYCSDDGSDDGSDDDSNEPPLDAPPQVDLFSKLAQRALAKRTSARR